MNKERDLLPWILGGLSAAAIAVAFAAVSTHRDLPISAPQMTGAQLPALPTATPVPATAAATAPPASPAAEPDAAPVSAPLQAQATAEPEVPSGQIWECTTKGVKTFSNNPCGEKSTLLDVGPINTMTPAPAIHYARGYGPDSRYAAGYADQSTPAEDPYSDQYAAESGGNSYTIIQGVGLVARRRAEHFHPAPPPPKSALNAGHNSGPGRRY